MVDISGLKRIDLNGYYAYYIPDHHLAYGNGVVYEHMLRAEEALGRELKSEEVVHHKDENRHNNSFDNLMVFKTSGDHTAFHNGCDIEKDGDVYVALKHSKVIDGRRVSSEMCPICGKPKSCNTKLCLECYRKEHAKNIPPKEELYELLPNHSMCEIGRMYNVSDNAVRKWCKKYGLPFKRDDIKQGFGMIDKKKIS